MRRIPGPVSALIALALLAGGAALWWASGRRAVDAPVEVAADPVAASTRRMARLLDEIERAADPLENPFRNGRRVAAIEEMLRGGLLPESRGEHLFHLAVELLHAGRSEESLRAFDVAAAFAATLPAEATAAYRGRIGDLVGVAWLRLGEQENCIARHGPESCLMPLREAAWHADPRGARRAIERFTALLSSEPPDLSRVWLLNLAHMTVGEYPAGVPAAWRLPPRIFESAFPLPRFAERAAERGVAVEGLSGGCVLEDLDRDGDLDLMVSSWGPRDPLRLLLQEDGGRFRDATAAAGLDGIGGGLNLVHADYDDDGLADVLVLRGAWCGEQGRVPNSLLRNLGGGRFEDVTEAAGVATRHPTQTAAWADYDGDGRLDLFVGNESAGGAAHPCELFRNRGDGTFEDRAADAGVAVAGFVKGVAWGDYDDDGRPDLYLSLLGEPNRLFRNDGPRGAGGAWRFTDVTAAAGVEEPRDSFATWFFDYDNDGRLDLFAAGYGWRDFLADVAADYLGIDSVGERPRLYRNLGGGRFEDVAPRTGLARVMPTMGAGFGDLDNDGWRDIYLGTGEPGLHALVPNRMFRNAAGKEFQDVTTAGGFGHLQKGHGVAFGDIDGDGDQDVYAVLGGAYEGDVYRNVLFENPGFGAHWITLRLEGTRSNRSAIGARIRVDVEEDGAARSIHAVVSTGGSFGSTSLQQEIGLGRATRIRRIEVRWPASGATQVIEEPAMDRVHEVREPGD